MGLLVFLLCKELLISEKFAIFAVWLRKDNKKRKNI